MNLAIAGDEATLFLANSAKRRALYVAAGCSGTICEYVTNDLYVANRTAARVEADLNSIRVMTEFASNPFYQTTCLPRTSSTNGFVDTAHQSVLSEEPQRIAFDTWLRGDSFTACTGYIEDVHAVRFIVQLGHYQRPGVYATV